MSAPKLAPAEAAPKAASMDRSMEIRRIVRRRTAFIGLIDINDERYFPNDKCRSSQD
jgi:hypothetical protein